MSTQVQFCLTWQAYEGFLGILVCLAVFLYVHQYVCPYVHPSVCLHVCQYVHIPAHLLGTHVWLYIHLSVDWDIWGHLCVCHSSMCLSVQQFVYPSSSCLPRPFDPQVAYWAVHSITFHTIAGYKGHAPVCV